MDRPRWRMSPVLYLPISGAMYPVSGQAPRPHPHLDRAARAYVVGAGLHLFDLEGAHHGAGHVETWMKSRLCRPSSKMSGARPLLSLPMKIAATPVYGLLSACREP